MPDRTQITPLKTRGPRSRRGRLAMLLLLLATPALGEPPVVENVAYSAGRFDVTLSHPDTGWDHYADGWRVELADGTILGTRVLAHPHVAEQPFTRSHLINLPEGVRQVFVRTSCSVDGWSESAERIEIRE